MKTNSVELSQRLTKHKTLSETEKATFYSHWTYSAIRQATGIENLQSVDAILDYFRLPRKHALEVLDFLVQTGLCFQEGPHFRMGPSSTHLESTSPWVRTHHSNWRQKAMTSLHNNESQTKLHYTAPMSLSAKDAATIRERIVQLLEQIDKIVEPSACEELHCLNIDWFSY